MGADSLVCLKPDPGVCSAGALCFTSPLFGQGIWAAAANRVLFGSVGELPEPSELMEYFSRRVE